MGVANHVYRRGMTYVWRRRLPAGVDRDKCLQITLGTRDPEAARRIAAVVTAHSGVIFDDMVQKRLTPAEARGLFNRVVREETAKLANPHTTLSHIRSAQGRLPLLSRLAPEVYAHAWLRALRHGQSDAEEAAFLARLEREEDRADHHAAIMHLNEEAGAHAAPFLHASERAFAEAQVAEAMRRAEPVSDDELLAAYRVILTARAAALAPERGLTIRSASEIGPADDLDPTAPRIPRSWFEDEAGPGKGIGAEKVAPPPALHEDDAAEINDTSVLAVAERVIDFQRDEGIKPAQQQQTRQTAALFIALTGVTDLRKLRQRHLAEFTDLLRKLPTSYGKSPKDRARPIKTIIAEAAKLPADKRGLSVATTNRHLPIIKRIVTRAGSEGIEVDRSLISTRCAARTAAGAGTSATASAWTR